MDEPDPTKLDSDDPGARIIAFDTNDNEGAGDSVIARLEFLAETDDEISFLDLLGELDYEWLSANDFIRAMKAALKIGAYPTARAISVEASNRYPTHAEIQKYACALAPPKVISGPPANLIAPQVIKNNWNWLRVHGSAYRGKWVALRSGELLGAADSLKDLTKDFGDGENVFLTIAY
ncbi:MAG: hypothetical protein J2P52_16115 [Blastocatellia bacterium]|nr:hypothetical protein [Blastocatellia bacterium]